MPRETAQAAIDLLAARVEALEAEAAVRRVQARYMRLCDTPCPEPGVADDAQRIDLIVDLYTDDAVWEGVGDHYEDQFGRAVGHDEIRRHFQRFWSRDRSPELVLNVHYLTSEQIEVHGGDASGQWVHVQPWLFADGSAVLRSSRLKNAFRRVGDAWKITRTRTENVLIAPLPGHFASEHVSRSVLLSP